MGKNKNTTIFLLCATITVWCVVGFKLVGFFSQTDKPSVEQEFTEPQSVGAPIDSLMLNYRDPFFPLSQESKHTGMGDYSATVLESTLPALEYKGLIRDGKGSVNAFISHHGRWDSYRVGAVIEGARIVDITAESLTVKWRGNDYTIAAK